jgi:hypothetical protein
MVGKSFGLQGGAMGRDRAWKWKRAESPVRCPQANHFMISLGSTLAPSAKVSHPQCGQNSRKPPT